jgi:hypothetical protein
MPTAPAPRKTSRLRFLTTLFAVVLVTAFFLPFFAQPKPAQALPGEALAAQVWRFIKDKIDDAIKLARKYSADIAFKNALKVYMTKFAEDTAIWVASAGKGQKPAFITNPHYWRDLTDAAAGDFLDTLSDKNLSRFGIDICKPADLRTQFSIESAVRALVDPANFCSNQCKANYKEALETDTFIIGEGYFTNTQFVLTLVQAEENLKRMKGDVAGGLPAGASAEVYTTMCDPAVTVGDCINVYQQNIDTYKRVVNQDYRTCLNLCSANKRVAQCTASQIWSNAEKVGGQIKNKEFIPKITKTFEQGENDIGQIITLAEDAKKYIREKQEEDKATRGDSDFQAIQDTITGEVKTPRSLVGSAAQEGLTKDPSGKIYSIQTGSPVADMIGVFTNTLTKQLLKRIFSRESGGGFNPGTNPQAQFTGSGVGVQAARLVFSTLGKVEYTTGGTSITLGDLASCPDYSPGPNNCVIDDGFRQAIEQGMTVKEAIDADLLHEEWPVGFTFNKQTLMNVEPSFKEGYPYRSILILRRLRILPVGWELAAQYMRDVDTAGGSANRRNLGALIEEYTRCGDAEHSDFCGLIDPNWVLKSPETFCKVSGSTAALTSNDYIPDPLYPDAPQARQIGRAESCVDEQTCLEDDENGNCRAYGYCLEERPSWKFGGDKCTPSYHSCEAYLDPNDAEFAYLNNTLDYANCTATNAGCKWYCKDYNFETGSFTCTDSTGAKERFTSKIKSCPDDAVGCSEFIRTTNTTNLLANGGFETLKAGDVVDDGVSDDFPGWTEGLTTEAVTTAVSGGVGAQLQGSGGEELTNEFNAGLPLNGQSTTLTFSGRSAGGCSGSFGMRTIAGGAPFFIRTPMTFSADWQRFTTTLTYEPSLTYDTSVITAFFELSGCSAIIDDVQMEFGTTFSNYKDYGSINTVYLNGTRRFCRAEEVGCTYYTSATDKIPGVVTSADFCPADMVGCRAFLEVPVTTNGANPDHPVRTGKRCSLNQSISCFDDGDCGGSGSCLPSVSLIPKTGKKCSAAYVGCEEYTNLDEVARGGEGKEYYSYIRQCVKPTGDPSNEKTFYTWIGSERTGFQLKAHLLKPTTALYSGPGDTVGGGPAYNDTVDPTDPTLCNEAIYETGENPDCQKFFDSAVNVYYRLYSKTITVSDDCHPLRNTIEGESSEPYFAIPAESTRCPASAAQCREYRGSSGFNTRTVFKDTFDDGDTIGWDGATWSTESLIFGGGSALAGGTLQTNADLDVPSQLENGRSYIVTFWAGAGNAGSNNATLTARFASGPASEYFDGEATMKWDADASAPLWNFYTLGPLHLDRDPGAGDHLQFALAGGSSYFIDNVRLYEVADNLYLIKGSYNLCTGNENCDRYTTPENKTVYLKSFTRLCAEDVVGCEALINTQNSDSPFEETFVNPRDVTERKTVQQDFVEFIVNDPKRSCRKEEQGCTRLGLPTLKLPSGYCRNQITLPCLSNTMCINELGVDVGPCVFPPIEEQQVQRYDTVFLTDDPDEYSTTLCWSDEVGCEAWRSKLTGATKYFHRPEPYTCEYKSYTLSGETFTDWVQTGKSGVQAGDLCLTRNPAPDPSGDWVPVIPYTQPVGFCTTAHTVPCRNDDECPFGGKCLNWAGVCPSEQSGCKEYRDTSDPDACRAECLLTLDRGTGKNIPVDAQCTIDPMTTASGCRGYWYVSSSVEGSASECNNVMNMEIGCRQFYSPDP